MSGFKSALKLPSEPEPVRRLEVINGVDPQAYLSNTLTCLVTGHPARDIDTLISWAFPGR